MIRMSAFSIASRNLRLCRRSGVDPRLRWMSVRPEGKSEAGTTSARKKMTIQGVALLRSQSTPITMLTAYDFPSARRTEAAEIDICLVGDSLAQTALGYDSTTRLTLDEMIHHCKAVARGAHTPLLVADMPFGSYQAGIHDAMKSAVRLVQEAGMEAVKMEGAEEILPMVKALTQNGIAVMGHLGLLPQRHASLSGYRVQGRHADAALSLYQSALALQAAGAFSIVLEAVPHRLAGYITDALDIPTIGIGAGPHCSGQVLVQDDALGVWHGHKAKFVRRFAEVGDVSGEGVLQYVNAVKAGTFPALAESYAMEEDEWEKFQSAAKFQTPTSEA